MTLLKTLTAAALIVSLGACADNMAKEDAGADTATSAAETVAADGGWTTLATREDYVAFVDGKLTTNNNGCCSFTSTADGTITGMVNDEPATGTWEWVDGKACFKMSWASGSVDRCNIVQRKDNQLRAVRPDGSTSESTVAM